MSIQSARVAAHPRQPGRLAARGQNLPESSDRNGCLRGLFDPYRGVTNSLFDGVPSESSAHFTFSTDVLSLTPLPTNGSVGLSFVSAGTFNVYYNPRPRGDWSNPAAFSSGQLIATFVREESLFPQLGPIGFHSLSETLDSAHSITFGRQAVDFKLLTPNESLSHSFSVRRHWTVLRIIRSLSLLRARRQPWGRGRDRRPVVDSPGKTANLACRASAVSLGARQTLWRVSASWCRQPIRVFTDVRR
jgi:hypothetical protein